MKSELTLPDLDAATGGDKASTIMASILITNGLLEGAVQGGSQGVIGSVVSAVGQAVAGLGGHKPY